MIGEKDTESKKFKLALGIGLAVVIAALGGGAATALLSAKKSNDARRPTKYLAAESLTAEQLLSYTDCILFTPIFGNNEASTEDAKERFYFDVQAFLQFVSTVLEGNDFIYLDFDDVKCILKESGFACLGVGHIKGADTKERMACMSTIEILSKDILKMANGAIMHVVGSEDIGQGDVEAAVDLVQPNMHSEGILIFGAGFDSDLHHEIQISVLAAGIADEKEDFEKGR